MGLCDRLAQDEGVAGLLKDTEKSVAGRVDVYCGGQIERSLRSVLRGGDGSPVISLLVHGFTRDVGGGISL